MKNKTLSIFFLSLAAAFGALTYWGFTMFNASATGNTDLVYARSENLSFNPQSESIFFNGTFVNNSRQDITEATFNVSLYAGNHHLYSFEVTVENIYSNSAKGFSAPVHINNTLLTAIVSQRVQLTAVFGKVDYTTGTIVPPPVDINDPRVI